MNNNVFFFVLFFARLHIISSSSSAAAAFTSLPKEIDFQKSDWLRVTPSFSRRKKKTSHLPFSPLHFRSTKKKFLSFFLLVLCISRAGENDEVYEIPSVGVTHRLICRFLCPFECVRAVVVLFSHRCNLSRPRVVSCRKFVLLPPISGLFFRSENI